MKKTKENFVIYKYKGKILAIIVRNNFKKEGMYFFTTENFSQQLASVCHEKGKVIKPHIHKKFKRVLYNTQEVDIIKRGKAKISLYTNNGKFFKSVILGAGDSILFASGGHGYKVIEDIELMTVKQGPYAGEKDKKYIKSFEMV